MSSATKIYVTRQLPDAALSLLRECGEMRGWEPDEVVPRTVLLQEVQEVDALLCMVSERIDEELLTYAPRLKVVANMAVGYDNVDVPALTRRRILLTNTPGVLTETTADLAFTLILGIARRIGEAERLVREGRWRSWSPFSFLGCDVHHATLGILGLGRIGMEVAKRAKGFDMHVLYTNRGRNREAEEHWGCIPVELSTLLRESDFLIVLVPLTPETRHLLSTPQFKLMKPGAFLINAARGPIVDQQALYEALRDGLIAGAALDVTDPEPIPQDDPLLSLENCLILPHIGSASIATRTRMATLAAENIAAFLAGHRPPTPVNPEVLGK
ncbi:MAG TPA: D-glycerate dehydrogenase [Candidatus Binatia bacterium]|nr:D-glycerate dehydrogenase [Candidatus Binatia bacterium]